MLAAFGSEDVREHPRSEARSDCVEPCRCLEVTATKALLHEPKVTSDGIVACNEEVGEGMTQLLFFAGQCIGMTLSQSSAVVLKFE